MDAARLIAWDQELRSAHSRLRAALAATRDALARGADLPDATSELVLYCIGFCAALDGHHGAEDRQLFPSLRAEHPELGGVIDKLMQDHSMLAHLLASLRSAAERGDDSATIGAHLDGIAAIMESHFRFEEREILEPLRTLTLDDDVKSVLGPL
ncbi:MULTISPECIES: hemerythrin domain-containing protein [unclassified Microbacterium]|uniref:hemerythrin domain-containing protein n=1 Tax=unclassified Microbacterium TaxID=2609290 RepID=UPI000DE50D8A|nr:MULTISPECIES: hemerythrin domain-containing protein [unclassified Microbacterium]NYF28892.1 hemerythrin-like domain-containing protein [Microbacterium sp. JAI119]RBO71387.1 hemerythrin domain-containing protein [Microbacterium sp. H6]